MSIYSVYVLSRAGGLIFNSELHWPSVEVERTYSFPLPLVLKVSDRSDKSVEVAFGERDGVRIGHVIQGINSVVVRGSTLEDGRNVFDVVGDESNYPLAVKFGRPRPTPNELMTLMSTFHSMYAISCQLSPEVKSSGIQVLETEGFRLHALQTLSGVKFIVLTDTKVTLQSHIAAPVEFLLRKIYEAYADFALKNPFYIMDQPIRCSLFDQQIRFVCEQVERGNYTALT